MSNEAKSAIALLVVVLTSATAASWITWDVCMTKRDMVEFRKRWIEDGGCR